MANIRKECGSARRSLRACAFAGSGRGLDRHIVSHLRAHGVRRSARLTAQIDGRFAPLGRWLDIAAPALLMALGGCRYRPDEMGRAAEADRVPPLPSWREDGAGLYTGGRRRRVMLAWEPPDLENSAAPPESPCRTPPPFYDA